MDDLPAAEDPSPAVPSSATPGADCIAVEAPSGRAIHRVLGMSILVSLLAALATTGLEHQSTSTTTVLMAGALGVAVAVTERWASLSVRLGTQAYDVTLSEMPLIAGLFLLPEHGLMLVLARILGVLVGTQVLQRRDLYKTVFNMVHLWVETLLAIALFAVIAPHGITDGGRVTLTVFAVALMVSILGSLAMSAVLWALEGRTSAGMVLRGITETIGPSLITSAAAVVSLAMAATSLLLLWAPLAITIALLVAYRAHVNLVAANGMQHKLLEFTRQITGEEDLHTTAELICQATRVLMDAPLVALRIEEGGEGAAGWVGVDRLSAGVMEHRLAVDTAGGQHDGCCARQLTTTLFARVGVIPGCWLAVTLHERTIDDHDRASIAMIANHAGVTLANAGRGQALMTQALEARHLADHDGLTGLPNRTRLLSDIREAIAEGEVFGLLLIDLDDFKAINDALGHAVGDTVLTEITGRLQAAGDGARVLARLGGDEFAAVIRGDQAVCIDLAERLREAIAVPAAIGPYTIQVGSSLGVALFPTHGTDADELLKHADLAMYEAKAGGGGTAVFGSAAGGRALRQLAISSGFRAALQGGDVAVAFQPVIDLQTDRLLSVEALARWTHPELGPIGPDEFVRVAEQAGLITDLTHQVLDTALAWQHRWAAESLDVGVSVNLSARSLLDAQLPLHVARHLAAHHVAPGRLTIELTESSIISDPQRTMAILHRLADLGVRLSIDDFGTGYSSLAYLRQLPAVEVKIDKSFVLPMADEASATSLVTGILRLCHELGHEVVAEGVETQAVQSVLRGLGCDRGQGYHIARPMPGSEVLDWALRRTAALAAARQTV